MRLVLLRHGQTHSNVAGALDTGAPGADLTELGIAQAQAAARVLAERDQPIEAVVTSTLVRTQQTGAPFVTGSGLVPVVREGIREIRAGDLEMRTDTGSAHRYRHTVAEWILGDLGARMPGGETGHEFLERYDAVVAEAAAHEHVLLISHGAAIRAWVSAHTDVDRLGEVSGHAPTDPLHNTGAIELEGDPDSGWRVLDWRSDPLGGHYLEDPTAPDPTGQEAEE
ncbi:MAG TPA: histidine phosphatase family protein [Marmoricola sp.]|jgi:probable phosphoglycerate mutase|nr:histidine phosphatase family protein [Marmoricola sp.]